MRKWIFRIGLVLALVVLTLAIVAIFLPEKIFCVDSGPVKGDVLVLLGGGLQDRAERAAELYKSGVAPRVIVSGEGDDTINRTRLIRNGVPPGAIQLEGKSRNTHENAECVIALLRAEKLQRIILVTSWYHSRRALATFQHSAPDLQFYSRPSYLGYDKSYTYWLQLGLARRIKVEYLKMPGYWLRYGVWPF